MAAYLSSINHLSRPEKKSRSVSVAGHFSKMKGLELFPIKRLSVRRIVLCALSKNPCLTSKDSESGIKCEIRSKATVINNIVKTNLDCAFVEN